MNRPPDHAARLLEAAALIEEVMATLDVRQEKCPACNVKHYADFTQYQHHKELDAIRTKLIRFAHKALASAKK